MLVVRKAQVERVAGNELVAEASSLSLAPGEWPTAIALVDVVVHVDADGTRHVRPESRVFERTSLQTFGEDLVAVRYRSSDGNVLTVLND